MRSAPVSEDRTAAPPCGAWHPGLESELPRELLPLATVFRRENVTTSLAEALELSDYCGLPPQDLVAFRPERLIIHELPVRVTAGVAVPDGTDYEDLGRNFREIASTILNKYIDPRLDDLKRLFEEKRSAASVVIARELSNLFSRRAEPAGDADQTSGTRWPFGLANKKRRPRPQETAEQRERRIILDWSKKAQAADNRLDRLCFRSDALAVRSRKQEAAAPTSGDRRAAGTTDHSRLVEEGAGRRQPAGSIVLPRLEPDRNGGHGPAGQAVRGQGIAHRSRGPAGVQRFRQRSHR